MNTLMWKTIEHWNGGLRNSRGANWLIELAANCKEA